MVSVIIPNYNHSLYLSQRIESVINQSYQDIEIIILDDCSTDNSVSIINNYIDNPKISKVVINENNVGSPFIQWEKGFALAKGEYIWIAESDDVADSDFLQQLIPLISNDDSVSVAFANSYIINSDGNIFDDYDIDDYDYPIITYHSGLDFIKYKMMNYTRIYNASSAIFRKNALEKIPRYYTEFRSAGDYLFWIELLRTGNIAWCHRKLNYFRKHNNNVTIKSNANGANYIERRKQLLYFQEKKYFSKYRLILMIGGEFYALTQLPKSIRYSEFLAWYNSERKFLLYAFIWFVVKIVRKISNMLALTKKYSLIPILYGKN